MATTEEKWRMDWLRVATRAVLSEPAHAALSFADAESYAAARALDPLPSVATGAEFGRLQRYLNARAHDSAKGRLGAALIEWRDE